MVAVDLALAGRQDVLAVARGLLGALELAAISSIVAPSFANRIAPVPGCILKVRLSRSLSTPVPSAVAVSVIGLKLDFAPEALASPPSAWFSSAVALLILDAVTDPRLELRADGSLPVDNRVAIALVSGLMFAVLDEPAVGASEITEAWVVCASPTAPVATITKGAVRPVTSIE